MTIQQVLAGLDIPATYSHFTTPQEPPFVVYIGDGQRTMPADDTFYHRKNAYQVEYYFNKKNEAAERDIEDAILAGGFFYEKSSDEYLDEEDLFVIYYTVWAD